MSKTIWKFPIEITDDIILSMPKDAEIISLQVQDGKPVMWAMVDPEEEKVERHFEMFGTGHPIETGFGINRKFIGTIQVVVGVWLAFHVFERY